MKVNFLDFLKQVDKELKLRLAKLLMRVEFLWCLIIQTFTSESSKVDS